MRNNSSFTNVYKNKNIKSEVVTQLIYGDTFKKLASNNSWIKIKNNSDKYIGFIKRKKFLLKEVNTHKVHNLFANLYEEPNIKNKINKKLSFGSKIKIIDKKNKFYKFDNLWIKKEDVKKINFKTKNIFKDIKEFIGVKYKWGGKHYSGIDCSGLVQLFINFNNKFCPRDAIDQIKFFKKKVSLEKIKKGDLIFWKGHVGVAVSRKKLIHAYGPLKKTIEMPIEQTIKRIYKTANLKVIGVRRVN